MVEIIETDEDKLAELQQPAPLKLDMQHPPMASVEDLVKHMRDMIKEGYTNEQIMQLHPEMKNFFGDSNGEETESS